MRAYHPARVRPGRVYLARGVFDGMGGSLGWGGGGEPDGAAWVGGCVGEVEVDDDHAEKDDDGVRVYEFGVCVGCAGGDYDYEG